MNYEQSWQKCLMPWINAITLLLYACMIVFFFFHIRVILVAMMLHWEMVVNRKVFCSKESWGRDSLLKTVPKFLSGWLCSLKMRDWALRSKTEMVSKSWSVGKEWIRTHLFGLRESSYSFLFGAWTVDQRCWWLQGWEVLSPMTSSNLDLRRHHFPALNQMTDEFYILPTFLVSQCLHISAQLSYDSPCSCCSTTALPLFTQRQTYTLLFTQLLKSIILKPVNSQTNNSNAIFVWSAYFLLGHTCILNSVAVPVAHATYDVCAVGDQQLLLYYSSVIFLCVFNSHE